MGGETRAVDQMVTKTPGMEGKYLTFSLDGEEYGIGILKVREIIGMVRIFPIPRTPEFVKGVINLRGKVLPVADLRLRFAMPPAAYTERACIIVIEASAANMKKCWAVKGCGKVECPAYESMDRRCWMLSGTHCRDEIQGGFYEKREACGKCDIYQAAHSGGRIFTTGIIVDSVSEVLSIKASEIEDAPSFGTSLNTDYILGMAKMGGGVKILLDIDRVFCANEVSALEKVA
jgi:purine-binding chemotaxis protein CheW